LGTEHDLQPHPEDQQTQRRVRRELNGALQGDDGWLLIRPRRRRVGHQVGVVDQPLQPLPYAVGGYEKTVQEEAVE